MNIACIKLVSGEELLAIVEEGPNPLEVTVHKPVVVNKSNTPVGPYMQVSHWLLFTKNNKATIKRDKIVALEYGLDDNAIQSYKDFIENKGDLVNLNNKERLDKLLQELTDLREYNENLEEEILVDEQSDANTTIH